MSQLSAEDQIELETFMNKEQNDVFTFMQKAGQDCPSKPTIPTAEVRKLRVKLIAEEFEELCDALRIAVTDSSRGALLDFADHNHPVDEVAAYDAILDLLVVTIGTAVAMGFHIRPGWDEVHRSNMSKFIDGHRRYDGKWVKGPSYSPAQLAPIIEDQKR